MESTSENMQLPVRSISLPARLVNPNFLKIEAELNKLKTCESSSPSAATAEAEAAAYGLNRLAELYNCIEEFIHSPCTQQSLGNQQHKTLVEQALDTSVGLLDACSNSRDLILIMKEQLQELQSALRRRGGNSSLERNIHAYISFRKKSRKDIAKCLKKLKGIETTMGSFPAVDVVDQHLSMVIQVLRESSASTISIFRSILLFLSMPPEMKAKVGGWNLVRKLIPSKKLSQEVFNEVGNVDTAICSLHGQIRDNVVAKFDVQMILNRLDTLDFGFNDIETGLDCLFRRLIQNRVSLLNMLTP
ncbi:DUF241 domain protein [Melia azedarach]|uniref:DUF241 domain protein n=1 Tax=Melia azedarach TaxID=155640 RepID=A0ACC1XRN3_MELAZ|nr:DUF241 domain protein [Melia azedarach]